VACVVSGEGGQVIRLVAIRFSHPAGSNRGRFHEKGSLER